MAGHLPYVPGTRDGRIALLLILVIALVLRAWGLGWGLPNSTHFYSFHPDEIDLAGRAPLIPFDPNPHFFNYGSLTIYLTTVVALLMHAVSGKPTPELQLGLIPTSMDYWQTVHLAGRLISVALGAATVYCTFVMTKALLSRDDDDEANALSERIALAAAALLAVLPGHVVNSHYGTVDVPATFFVVASAMFAARMLHSNSLRLIALSSACAGFAAAAKYNAALALVFVLAARRLADWQRDAPPSAVPAQWLIALPFIALPFPVAFLAGCPFSVLNFPTFWKHFTYEVQHVRTGSGLIFVGVGPGWWNHLSVNLPFAMTTPLLVCSLAGLLMGLRQRARWALFVSAFVLPYSLMIGAVIVSFLRYTIPLLPFLCVAAAWLVMQIGQQRWRRAALGLLLVIPLLASIDAVYPFSQTDPRDTSATWIQQRARSEDRFGLLTTPWFWTPTLTCLNGGPRSARAFATGGYAKPYVITAHWDIKMLEREEPEWFVTSEFETRDELRLRDPNAVKFLEALDARYELAKSFKTRRRLPLPGRDLWVPHDWLYPNPEIRVYRRRDSSER